VPGLVTLDVEAAAPHLGGRRIREAAAALGLLPRPLAFDELNRDPHPFP
jgi:hypothetical protein